MLPPIRMGRRPRNFGRNTALMATSNTVSSPNSVSNDEPLMSCTATGARLRPMTATIAPVNTGGISFSIQPVPVTTTIKPITA